jgi:hypothetical protein
MFDISYFLNNVFQNKNNRLKESFIEKNFKNFHEFIMNNYEGFSFLEKLYNFYKNPDNTCYCGNKTSFISFSKGYLEYCSVKCSSSSKKTRDKYKKTCIEKWGVDNISKTDDAKRKKEETCIKRYGKKSHLQTDYCKKRIVEIYGVDNVFQSDSIKEKIKETNLNKYGFNVAILSDSIKEKAKKTNLERWGVDHFSKTIEWKENIKKVNDNIYLRGLNLPNNYKYLSKEGNTNKIIHLDCGEEFEIQTQLIRLRIKNNVEICKLCNKINWKKENNLKEYIQSIYSGEIIQSYRDGLEIDIYLPGLKLGFEFNGLYWHSELFKDKNYHLNKTNWFKERGIRIIHIWEDDWIFKQDIIRSIIKSALNLSDYKIWARDCKFRKIDNIQSKEFLNKNHLQGWCVSSYRYALFYKDEIVSVVTIGKNRINIGHKNYENFEYELVRFSNKIGYNIIGGFSKLIKNIISDINIKKIITYSDSSIFKGDVYIKNGFKYIGLTSPNYYYIIDNIRKNRFNYTKTNLIKLGYDKNKTEKEIMFNNKNYRIYDCGNYKYELNI